MNYKMPKSYQTLHKAESFNAELPFVWAASGDNGEKGDAKVITDVIAANIPAILLDGYNEVIQKIVQACFTRYAQNAIQAERRNIDKAVEGASFQACANEVAQDFLDWANSVKPEPKVRASKVLTAESMAIEDIAKAIVFHKPGTKIADARKRAVEFHKAGATKIWVAALEDATKKFNAMQAVPEGEEY